MALASLVNVGTVPNDGTGDQPRTAFQKINAILGNVFSVTTYGALGDGSTDDTVALQAAITACVNAGGGTVYFPLGTFITTLLQINVGGVTIQGAGIGATIVKRKSSSISNSSGNNTGDVFFVNYGTAGQTDPGTHLQFITFRDLTIDGNAAGNPGLTSNSVGCHGIQANYTDGLFCLNVEAKNCLETGFYAFGCSKTRWVACLAHNNGLIGVASSRNGWAITGPQDTGTHRGVQDEHILVNCESYSNTDEGISVGRNGRIVISGCIIHDNGDTGIEGDTGSASSDTTSVPAGWTISGCHIYSNGTNGIGIGNANVQRATIIGNVVEDNPKVGISLSQVSGALIVVAGNIVRNWGTISSGDHGITLNAGSGVDGTVVSNNLLNGGAGTLSTGIVLIAQTAGRRIQINDNIILSAGGGGISLTGSLIGRVSDNLIDTTVSAFTTGLTVSSGSSGDIVDLQIDDNMILNAIASGILLRTNGTSNITGVTVRNNYIRANGTFGLSISEAGGGVITQCILEGNQLGGNTSGAISGAPAAGFAVKRNNRLTTGLATGQVTLSAANPAATVSTAEVIAADNIQLSRLASGGTPGHLSIGTITAGTSFTIVASGNADTSTVYWELVH